MKSYKVTIVGGSNSVMQPGYLSAMLEQTRKKGVDLDIVANLAVGGTSSACGLYRLKTSDAIERSDLLIIEYALNDGFIYGDERRPVRHWARIYEGIIRHAIERNPDIIICSVIFGSRNGAYISAIPSIDAGIHYLSSRYGTSVVDVSSILLERLGRHVISDPKFYMDQGHYARPIVTSVVGAIVADAIIDVLGEGPRAQGLPEPVDQGNFSSAGTLTAADLSRVGGTALVRYENRLFREEAFDVADQQVSFSLTNGKLLALIYICEPQGGVAVIGRGDRSVSCAMMKSGVQSGQFKFLTSMLTCDFLYGAQLLSDDEGDRYSISMHQGAHSQADHVAKDNVHHLKPAARPVLPLVGILYSGTLHDLQVGPAVPQTVHAIEASTAA